MSGIKTIVNKETFALPWVWRLALKSIYDKKNLTFKEEADLHHSVVKWTNHMALRKDMNGGQGFTHGSIDAEQEMMLMIIGAELYKDDQGELEKRKEMFARHKIDYKKFYRLPGSVTARDKAKGQEILEKHKRDCPEDYE